MPGRTTRFTHSLRQTAVYWARPTAGGYGGWTFGDPVELSPASDNGVRWEETQERFMDAQGKERVSKAVVFTAQDVQDGGYLYLGALDDLASDEQADPQLVAAAQEIKGIKKVPDHKAEGFERRAWL